MSFMRKLVSVLAFSALSTSAAFANQPLKIGMILPMSGPFAAYGKQILNGANLYIQQNGSSVANREVQLIIKDDTGIAPELSKRHAQELLIKDKVDILAGFGLSPSAFSVAPLATQAKKPMIVLNAATSSITTKSPYITRVSFTLAQVTAPVASWAINNNIKNVYTIVSDYGPGHDAEQQFIKTFTQAGGNIVASIRTPVSNPDFSAYVQRAKDAKPDAIFLFVPSGEQGVAFSKEFKQRGLAEAGIQLIATGDLTDEHVLDTMGEPAIGLITSYHYSQAHDSPENADYVQSYTEAYPNMRPNFMSVAGYDGMHVIYSALEKNNGDASGPKFIEAISGMQWTSPRGPVSIDPETRDIVQDIYIRKVEQQGSILQNIEFDKIEKFADPGKE